MFSISIVKSSYIKELEEAKIELELEVLGLKQQYAQLMEDWVGDNVLIEFVEMKYGSGKAMQVADILRGE